MKDTNDLAVLAHRCRRAAKALRSGAVQFKPTQLAAYANTIERLIAVAEHWRKAHATTVADLHLLLEQIEGPSEEQIAEMMADPCAPVDERTRQGYGSAPWRGERK